MVRGDPVWAVLIPPRLSRFRELVHLGDEQLDVDFTGWNKFVLLSKECAFLFPREAPDVECEIRSALVYQPIGSGRKPPKAC